MRLADILSATIAAAALVLVAPAHDLCGWTGRFDAGALLLLAVIGLATMGAWIDAREERLAAALKKMAAGLPLGLAVLTGLLAWGTFNLQAISLAQGKGFSRWNVFHDPFSAAALVLALIAVQGVFQSRLTDREESKDRRPWGNCAGMFVICALLTSVFLGAWYDPFGIVRRFEMLSSTGSGAGNSGFAALANALGVIVFCVKTCGLFWVEQFFGKHLPRYRLGEIAGLGVQFLLPAAGFNFLAAAGYLWLVEPLPAFQTGMRWVLAVLVPLLAVIVGLTIMLGRRGSRAARSADTAQAGPLESAPVQ